VAERLPSAAGPLMHSEVQALSRLLQEPSRPYSVVLGGAKVSDKLGVMRALLPRVDSMLVGGGMCFTLLAAQGHHVGGSLLEEERIEEVRDLLASDRGDRVILPSDVKVGESFAEDVPAEVCPASQIPDQAVGLDIGPQTADRFGEVLGNSGSIFWNGPMGVFEWDEFRAGTEAVARAVAANQRFTVAGGGDTIAALRLLGLQNQLSHLSTGGGAALEFLEGQTLPGLAALEKWADWRPGR
ncbi:MAG: phosphoglycerate kinase, partial [Actinomycetota bacterium]|nr:phosphoglycerate kinase [Actinomycetota bacterium]